MIEKNDPTNSADCSCLRALKLHAESRTMMPDHLFKSVRNTLIERAVLCYEASPHECHLLLRYLADLK